MGEVGSSEWRTTLSQKYLDTWDQPLQGLPNLCPSDRSSLSRDETAAAVTYAIADSFQVPSRPIERLVVQTEINPGEISFERFWQCE
jgi:hypothetical protein